MTHQRAHKRTVCSDIKHRLHSHPIAAAQKSCVRNCKVHCRHLYYKEQCVFFSDQSGDSSNNSTTTATGNATNMHSASHIVLQ